MSKLPTHVPYLIIGAGTAAMAAYRAIRTKHADAKVLLIGEEEYRPYMRPPLSKVGFRARGFTKLVISILIYTILFDVY